MQSWLWSPVVQFPAADLPPGAERGHDVAMGSFTMPHAPDEDPRAMLRRLYGAHARFLRSARWRRFAARWGVVGAVRVLDATWSAGVYAVHPHFHVALFLEHAWIVEPSRYRYKVPPMRSAAAHDAATEQALEDWLADELTPHLLDDDAHALRPDEAGPRFPAMVGPRYAVPALSVSQPKRELWLRHIGAELVEAWIDALQGAGAGLDARAIAYTREHGLELTGAEHAQRYFAKWGLPDEVAKSSSKASSPLRLLDAQGAGDHRAGLAFQQWRRATHGQQQVTGVQDLLDALAIDDEQVEEYMDTMKRRREEQLAAEGTPVVKVAPLHLEIAECLYPSTLALGRANLFALIDEWDARGVDAQEVLDLVLTNVDAELQRAHYAGRDRPTRAELRAVAENALSVIDLDDARVRRAGQARGSPDVDAADVAERARGAPS
jgi:hypothetical protein